MALCLNYQAVYCDPRKLKISARFQLLAAALLLVALSVKVWIQIESTDAGYRLAEARDVMVQLDMERRELELQRSVLLRPDKLHRVAHVRLGLLPLKASQARKVRLQ